MNSSCGRPRQLASSPLLNSSPLQVLQISSCLGRELCCCTIIYPTILCIDYGKGEKDGSQEHWVDDATLATTKFIKEDLSEYGKTEKLNIDSCCASCIFTTPFGVQIYCSCLEMFPMVGFKVFLPVVICQLSHSIYVALQL